MYAGGSAAWLCYAVSLGGLLSCLYALLSLFVCRVGESPPICPADMPGGPGGALAVSPLQSLLLGYVKQ